MSILNLNKVTTGTGYVQNVVNTANLGAQFLFYTGTPPTDASIAPSGTLLGTLTYANTVSLGTVTAGVSGGASAYVTFNLPPSANGVATGTPGFVRLATAAGVGVIDMDVTSTGGGGTVIMTPDTITAGAPFQITSGSLTAP